MFQGPQATADSLANDTALVAALSKKNDALRLVIVVEVERDDASRRVTIRDSSFAATNADLQAVEHEKKGQLAKHYLLLQKMRNATLKVSRRDLAVPCICEILGSTADNATKEGEAVVEHICLEADEMSESLSGDVKAARRSNFDSLESLYGLLGYRSSHTNAAL